MGKFPLFLFHLADERCVLDAGECVFVTLSLSLDWVASIHTPATDKRVSDHGRSDCLITSSSTVSFA